MDDLSERPADHERDALVARIDRAAAAGQISSVDRDIRLANVKSAQSRAELDLMSRDLDQLEGALGAGPAAAPGPRPYSTFDPRQVSSGSGPSVVVSGSRRALVVALVAVVIAVVAGGGVGLAGLAGLFHHEDTSTPQALPPAQTEDADASDAPSDAPSGGAGASGTSEYALTVKGLTGFLATYATKFGTPRAVQLVLYPDYAVVEVPVQGGRGRQAGWLYRPATGWTSFGGVTAVFPGSSTVDTRQLDVAALMRNIRRARATLKVEHPSQTYVIVRYIPTFDTAPSADVYVANQFNESGYLATRLDGSVERAYPFGQ